MKIIAATSNRFIVEMTPRELSMIALKAEIVTQEYYGRPVDHSGKEFDINPAFQRLHALADNHTRLTRIVAQFKAMGELLEPVVTEVENLTTAKEDDTP